MALLQEKYEQLKSLIVGIKPLVVAFSGGVDSTLLLKVAHDLLGEQVCAITATSPTYPQSEYQTARELAAQMGVRHLTIESNELEIPGFSQNPPDRCYHCKLELFQRAAAKARELGFTTIVDGSTLDDLTDYRPGRKALAELAVRSPLLEAGFTKADVRALSFELGLPTWDKQPYACLASRFPYGVDITAARLKMVEECEEFLREQGFRTYRVRFHHETARLELAVEEFPRLLDPQLRQNIVAACKRAGFTYVTLDLQGYRTGSMNETLSAAERA